jgi:hypothetical protein
MSEVEARGQHEGRWALWSVAVLAAYGLSIGPATLADDHLSSGGLGHKALRFLYKPLRVVARYTPGTMVKNYIHWWYRFSSLPPDPFGPDLLQRYPDED